MYITRDVPKNQYIIVQPLCLLIIETCIKMAAWFLVNSYYRCLEWDVLISSGCFSFPNTVRRIFVCIESTPTWAILKLHTNSYTHVLVYHELEWLTSKSRLWSITQQPSDACIVTRQDNYQNHYLSSISLPNPKFIPVADKFCLTLTCDRQGFAWMIG